jgi:alkanesulfonate monooxygenase SsuD/methylene tetrahydromethanopterin reductase-like flavin-dependent oxidoreductase (luciferase family)
MSYDVYDVYGGSADAALEWAVEAPANDPFMYVPALAAITERLPFVITASTTYEHPFSLARRFGTLDHLSNGRIGWNTVLPVQRGTQLRHGRNAQARRPLRPCGRVHGRLLQTAGRQLGRGRRRRQ